MRKYPPPKVSALLGSAEAVIHSQAVDTEAMDGLDLLIQSYAPANDEICVEVGERTYRFLALTDRAKFNAVKRQAATFAESKAAPPAMPEAAEWMDTDRETKVYACLLAELSIEPKLNAYRLLKVAKKAFLAFEELRTGYLVGLAGKRIEEESREIETRKNESSGISPGATASR